MRRSLVSFALVACIAAASVPAYSQQSAGTLPTCASGDPVVWVNTSTKKYHLQGDSYYGKTKQGKYACKSAADAQGDKQAKMSSSKMSGSAPATNMNSGAVPAMKASAAPMNGTNAEAAPSPAASGMMGSKHHRRHRGSKASPSPEMMPSPAPTE